MKKFLSIALVLMLVISQSACSDTKKTNQTPAEQPSVNEQPTSTEPSAADIESAYQAEPASKRTINIGYDSGLCQAAVPIAQFKGFFEAEGLNTQLTKTGGTLDNARDALAGGKIDTTTGMIAGWLKPVTNGVDIRFTVGLHTGCTSAFVLADSDITHFNTGQTVAVSGGIGGVNHNIAYRFIAHDGFVPEDFTWKDFPADQTLLVLQNGDAEIAVLGDQLAEKWVADGTLRRIRSLHEDEDFADEACCVLGISGAFLDENPVTSEKISRAVYKAALWIGESDENKAEAAKILLDNGYISGSEEYALQLMKMFEWGLPNDLTEKTLYDSVDEYQSLGVISKDLDADAIKEQIWNPLNIE
ncbi:ABC transporter substrate-binding protein [Sedimentibacter sp.]|uniref:ABC transporter substrate-binding protein n=1 Tax=Sedimentibacter sp. TaxID=1960295 RepID=UPI00289D66D9|nr:ABC transporter substrate-binding protein [Sedimentibacter sp.]